MLGAILGAGFLPTPNHTRPPNINTRYYGVHVSTRATYTSQHHAVTASLSKSSPASVFAAKTNCEFFPRRDVEASNKTPVLSGWVSVCSLSAPSLFSFHAVVNAKQTFPVLSAGWKRGLLQEGVRVRQVSQDSRCGRSLEENGTVVPWV